MPYANQTSGEVVLYATGAALNVAALLLVPDAARHETVASERGPYSELPLSGVHLPSFGRRDDILTWHDILPVKQRLKFRGTVYIS